MEKSIKFKSLFIKLVIWGLIPVILIMIGMTLSLVKNFSVPYSVLLYQSKIINTSANYNKKIIEGESIKGQFIAKDNNLGAITIRFNPIDKVRYDEEDGLVFRIKEVGQAGWYYRNKYKSGLIQENPDFPFGFPSILDSKNKLFQFEITSLNGNKKNAVNISRTSSNLVGVYQFPMREIKNNQIMFVNFLHRKVINALSVDSYFVSMSIYMLPFIGYIYLLIRNKRKYVLVVLLALFDCFLISGVYNWIFWIITFLWIVSIWRLNLNSHLSFKLALSFIAVSFFLLLLSQQSIAEKSALWSFMFLSVGAIQELLDSRKSVDEVLV